MDFVPCENKVTKSIFVHTLSLCFLDISSINVKDHAL